MTGNNSRIPRNLLALCALAGLFAFANPAAGQVANEILTVSPNSATQGTSGLTVIFTLDTDMPPAPPADVMPTSVMIGTLTGSSVTHPSQYTVTALFNIPTGEAVGTKNATISFMAPSGTLTFAKSAGFTVTAMPNTPPSITNQPQSKTLRPGASATFSVTASGSTPLAYRWQKNSTNVTSTTNSSHVISSTAASDAGNYRCIVTNAYGAATSDVAVLTINTNVASLAADDAADGAYDAGWTNGANGGSGFGPWQLIVGGMGGHFTASSAGNSGGGSGNIDTSGRSWGLWSTNGVTEAVRPLTGGTLTTGQVFKAKFDNGFIANSRSVGLALQNGAGSNLWEFFFSGGDGAFTVTDGSGSRLSSVPFTGDGLTIEFQPKASGTYLALVADATGSAHAFSGSVISQTDQEVARIRFWNYEAGAGSDYDLYVNSLSVRTGELTYVASALLYPVVDTGQTNCYNDTNNIAPPAAGQPFYGQDAQVTGTQPSYTKSSDGLTVYDSVTDLTWQQSPDTNGDGTINASDKMTLTQAQARPAVLNAAKYGGYSDWRLPTIKELYSLMNFMGTDVGPGSDASTLTPFIDRTYFSFGYGDTTAGERVLDAQYASITLYVSKTMLGDTTLFGVNFADGRIKGYGLTMPGGGEKNFYVQCVRGAGYGVNDFVDNGDSTISDRATGLMWTKADSGTGMNWSNALAWVQTKNAENHLGHSDWRLPNAKELQSLVDYTRSPDTTSSAAIDPRFTCTGITNEAGKADYPFYWTGTTHISSDGTGANAIYVAFGRAMGYMTDPTNASMGAWLDVHGAGAQRSDPKVGNPADYPQGHGPQGDAIRIYNYVRLVRDYSVNQDSVGDGIPDWWRAQYFGGTGTTTNDQSCATCDPDQDGSPNHVEERAGTSPTNSASSLAIEAFGAAEMVSPVVTWQSVNGKNYRIQRSTNLLTDGFTATLATGIAATSPMNTYTDTTANAGTTFYRIAVE